MGDRANCVVVDGGSRVFLYTHWDGQTLPTTVREALLKRERWDDGQYLARIIFDQMTGLKGGSTGYGISSKMGDNSYPLLVVNVDDQQVYLEDAESGEKRGPVRSIEDFVVARKVDWKSLAR